MLQQTLCEHGSQSLESDYHNEHDKHVERYPTTSVSSGIIDGIQNIWKLVIGH